MKIVLFLYCLRVCLTQKVKPGVDFQYLAELKEDDIYDTDITDMGWEKQELNSTLYTSINKYYCRAPNIEFSDFIVYGSKAWTFPAQDVSLNLEYPSKNFDFAVEEDIDYILTGLTVILRHESSNSRGYITSGGMLQDHISMTFVFGNITSLSYEFYLYGIPRNVQNFTDNYTAIINLC